MYFLQLRVDDRPTRYDQQHGATPMIFQKLDASFGYSISFSKSAPITKQIETFKVSAAMNLITIRCYPLIDGGTTPLIPEIYDTRTSGPYRCDRPTVRPQSCSYSGSSYLRFDLLAVLKIYN